ncbi:MAG: class I SAM-dependent methyltransferase [Myxococcota bacterium]
MTSYSLGSDDPEIKRLDLQAASLEAPTRALLRAGGLRPGMRVLDLGCGLGHVASIAAEIVGAEGAVVGIDNQARMIEVANSRASANVRFLEGDVRTWRDAEPFDAIIGRLILFHLPDAVAVLQHHMEGLKPDGLVLSLDFDLASIRAEPQIPTIAKYNEWLLAGFRSVGANPVLGARLILLLAEAGLAGVQGAGMQSYLAPDDPRGPAMFAGVIRSLAPAIVRAGIATEEQLDIDTLADRVGSELKAANAVILPPVLGAAWGRKR